MGNFYDRYSRLAASPKDDGTKSKPKPVVTKYHCTVHTCPKNKRYIVLKGLGAIVTDVTPGMGEIVFSIRPEDWHDYQAYLPPPDGSGDWDGYFLSFFRKLHERNQVGWLRLLHNPNVAFICQGHRYSHLEGVLLTPRQISAKFVAAVFAEKGYMLNVKNDVKKL